MTIAFEVGKRLLSKVGSVVVVPVPEPSDTEELLETVIDEE